MYVASWDRKMRRTTGFPTLIFGAWASDPIACIALLSYTGSDHAGRRGSRSNGAKSREGSSAVATREPPFCLRSRSPIEKIHNYCIHTSYMQHACDVRGPAAGPGDTWRACRLSRPVCLLLGPADGMAAASAAGQLRRAAYSSWPCYKHQFFRAYTIVSGVETRRRGQ
jgi:hypothetical protein